MERRTDKRPIFRHRGRSQGHARQRRRALKANEVAALAAFNDKNSATMGTDVRTMKAKDDPLGQRIFDTINKSSGGDVLTVNYNFAKPGTTEPVPKESFVTKVGNEGCGVGYYK
jgi:hypothetical protein